MTDIARANPFGRILAACLAFALAACATAEPPVPARAPIVFIEEYAASNNFNGTVLVADAGEIIYLSSFGKANLAFDVPNTPATRYRAASITKLLTAVLILQLEEQGRIDLAAPIAAYLPGYTGEGRDTVTIHQLLNHTSGIDNMDKVTSLADALENGVPPYQTPRTSDQMLTAFASGPLVSAPGATFSYNNADYIILGKIIEQVTGKPYEDVLRERILAPLGMADSGMMRQDVIVPNLADTYFYRDDIARLVPDLPVYAENVYAAGALYSDAADIFKFSNALLDGNLLTKDSLARLLTPGLDDYGYGTWVYTATVNGEARRILKRPGSIMGAQAQLYRYVEDGVTVIVLSNTANVDMDGFVTQIGKRITGYN
jgi:D-alanyl-D-alanine carboxypeptidase